MYKLTIYESSDAGPQVEEFDDEDDIRDRVEDCMGDLERKTIKTFIVSWIKE